MENSKSEHLSPEKSLVNTIANSNLVDLTTDIGEVFFDKLFEESLVRDFPIIGTVVGIGKAGIAIRDYLFLKKKLLNFFTN